MLSHSPKAPPLILRCRTFVEKRTLPPPPCPSHACIRVASGTAGGPAAHRDPDSGRQLWQRGAPVRTRLLRAAQTPKGALACARGAGAGAAPASSRLYRRHGRSNMLGSTASEETERGAACRHAAPSCLRGPLSPCTASIRVFSVSYATDTRCFPCRLWRWRRRPGWTKAPVRRCLTTRSRSPSTWATGASQQGVRPAAVVDVSRPWQRSQLRCVPVDQRQLQVCTYSERFH